MAGLLRIAQQHTGASQARLATAIGLSQSRTNELINGRRQVLRLDVLERIAAGLAMPDTARMILGLAPVLAATATSVDDLATFTGITSRTYASQAQAARDILGQVRTATTLDMLIVRGLGLLGLNGSLLRTSLTVPRSQPLLLRIALLNPRSEAAKARAMEIGESSSTFAAGIRLSQERLADLAHDARIELSLYLYDRLPTWRLLIVDDVMFVGTFDPDWEGHTSPVYRLDPGTGGAFHRGMRRTYEELLSSATRVV